MSDSTLYTYVTSTGLIVPDTSTILTEVQGEYQAALGADISLDSSKPQGALISAETTARSNVIQNNALVSNQINPNYAGGILLDAVCALSGLDRNPDTFTTVSGAVLTGQPGSPIAVGSQAATSAGDLFQLDAAVELDSTTGTITGNFTALAPGPVPCGAGTLGLVRVVTGVLGWETVSSPNAGVLGTAEQGDEALRLLRRQTLFLQGVGMIGATLSAVNALTGVIGTQGLENMSSSPGTISGIAMAGSSIWICVDGGLPADIATALLQNKSSGCGWNGSQSLTLIEPSSGQLYLVEWEIPTAVPLLVEVQYRQANFKGDAIAAITAAVLAFATNQVDGLQGFTVGENASPFEVGSAVTQLCPGIYVKAVRLSATTSASFSPTEIAMAINQKATVASDAVSVVPVT